MKDVFYGGKICTSEKSPYIYVIVKDKFIYIGESQDSPIKRWNSHISKSGTFQKNLKNRDEEIANNPLIHITFFCWKLISVQNKCMHYDLRRTTQYIEHMIHVYSTIETEISERFEIISDTTRTAPNRCSYTSADNEAKEITSQIAKLCRKIP